MEYIYAVTIDNYLVTGTPPLISESDVKNGKARFFCEEILSIPGVNVELYEWQDASTKACHVVTRIFNNTERTIRVSRADAGVSTIDGSALLHCFSSFSAREFEPLSIPLAETNSIQSLAGRSSKGYAPWAGLECPEGFFSVTVEWSGNWQASTVREDGHIRLFMGIYESDFYTDVPPGECFDGARVYIAFSAQDMESACAASRKFFLNNVSILHPESIETLPVIYNTWWCFEDRLLSEEKCLSNAKIAKEAGVTNFVLDAGWFGKSIDGSGWYEKRGDWDIENTVDFPSGIKQLGESINALGIKFGIWCEIEAVGKDSRLCEKRPELIAKRHGRLLNYVCFGNPKTIEWALDVFDVLIRVYGAKWIKLDFNMDPYSGCTCDEHGHGQGDGLYSHYMGIYRFLDAVRERYPDVILENCSSGGMRLDYGMCKHMHYSFLSDPDYVEHHFQCLWGVTSYIHQAGCYHFTQSENIGNMNGALKNPISADMSSEQFDFYIRAGMLCVTGFSYDMTNWPEWCVDRLKEHVTFFKEISKKYILLGDMQRLTGQALRYGRGDRWQAYRFNAEDGTALAFVFRLKGAQDSRNVLGEDISDMMEESSRIYSIDKNGTICRVDY